MFDPSVSAILFDKDGTLFRVESRWRPWIASLIEGRSRARPDEGAAFARMMQYDTLRQTFGADAMADGISLTPTVPLAPLLSEFRARGFALGVATNDTEQAARAHLAEAGVLMFFDAVLGYDSGFGAKPHPGMAHAFFDKVGIPAAAGVVIGDTLYDLMMAKSAGAAAVGVLTGAASAADLQPLADAVLEDIGGLRSLVIPA
jgi:phosphoglycolate phosphatase